MMPQHIFISLAYMCTSPVTRVRWPASCLLASSHDGAWPAVSAISTCRNNLRQHVNRDRIKEFCHGS